MTTLPPSQNQDLRPEQVTFNPVELYRNSLTSPHSKRMMRRALQRVVEAMGGTFDSVTAGTTWVSLVQKCGENTDVSRISAVRAELERTHKLSTADRSLVALRQVLCECWRAGLLDSAGYALAAYTLAGIKDLNVGRISTGRDTELREASAVFAACKELVKRRGPKPVLPVDVALFALFFAGMHQSLWHSHVVPVP